MRGLGFRRLADFGQYKWVRAGSGKIDFGRIFVRNATFVFSPRERVLTRGYWGSQNGLARGLSYRLAADARFSGREILNASQFCLFAMLSRCGFPAYQMAFGPIPVHPYMPRCDDSDFDFAQDASIPGQFAPQDASIPGHFAPQWKLWPTAQGAARGGISRSELRRMLGRNKSF